MSRKRGASLTGGTGDYNPQYVVNTIGVVPHVLNNKSNFILEGDDTYSPSQFRKELYFPGTVEINSGSQTTVVELLHARYQYLMPYHTSVSVRENAFQVWSVGLTDGGTTRANTILPRTYQIQDHSPEGCIDFVNSTFVRSLDAPSADRDAVVSAQGQHQIKTDFRDGSGRGIVVYNNRITITYTLYVGFSQSESSTHGAMVNGKIIVQVLYRFKKVPINDLLTKRAALEFV